MIEGTAANSITIDKTAVIGPEVRLGQGCEIGPYCVLLGNIELGPRNRLVSHVRLDGRLRAGSDNVFFPFSSVGARPQDLKYQGEDTAVILGSRNVIRECVTINKGTFEGVPSKEGVTRLGDDNLIMAYTHLAHDCVIHNRVVIANSTQLAGHVIIEDDARLGGANLVVQHVRIGKFAFTGAGSVIRKDVAPFVLGSGEPVFRATGINRVGLERRGLPTDMIEAIRTAYRIFFLENATQSEAIASIRDHHIYDVAAVRDFVGFILESRLGVHRP